MKRYLLFAGIDYYARGGWYDFIGDFASVEEAIEAVPTHTEPRGTDLDLEFAAEDGELDFFREKINWAHIVDNERLAIVWARGT